MPEMMVKGGLREGSLKAYLEERNATGELRIMGREGDVRITWNARDADEVTAAERQFNDLTDKGFRAYAVTEGSGGKGDQITEFQADAQKIILAPPMAGGC